MDRISRDAVAYPEQFDRRTGSAGARPAPRPDSPSLGRTVVRVAVIATVIVLVATLVLVAATANAAAVPLSILTEVV